jgi:membrane protein CcdC involved in cytochrome C biogenesis
MVLLVIFQTVIAILMASFILFIRMRAAKKPVSKKKILLPPLFMSTGFLMFLHPLFHVEIKYVIVAFLIGCALSIILIKTSKFEQVDQEVYLKRSKLFIVIILSFVIVRLILRSYVNQYITLFETSSLFFILAFGMILPWRIAMYTTYKKFINNMT